MFLGQYMEVSGGNFEIDHSWAMGKDFWLVIGNGPQLGNQEE